MLRSINGEVIFKDNEDYDKFLKTIREYKEVSQYEIYAYCLMNNHIHLLLKEGKETLGNVFRRIGASYVYWYNRKYKRRGHLFQDRYKSETIEDDGYFLTALRYIHQNPIKAGIKRNLEEYPWSSYNEYFGENDICKIKFALSLFSVNLETAISLFHIFHTEKNNDNCLEHEQKKWLDDEEATEIIIKVTSVEDITQIKEFEKDKIKEIIRELKKRGLSIRQIVRLTGLSFAVVRKI